MVRNNEPKSRQERRQAELQQEEKTEGQKQLRKPKIRLIPIWARLFIIVVLMVTSLCLGLMVGYGVIGSGDPTDALEKSTWISLINLVTGGE